MHLYKNGEVIPIETFYLIDYENVNSEGLTGCNKLGKSDHIVIFFTKNAKKIDMSEIADHGEADMDMCEVQRRSLYKRFPFQYWESEAYAPEQLNFYEMALAGYKLRWRAEKLYICEYLPDGQTKDDRLVKRNPMGFAMMYNQNILLSKSWKEKCVNTVRMTALAVYAKHPKYIFSSNAKALALVTYPLGAILAMRRKRQYDRLG